MAIDFKAALSQSKAALNTKYLSAVILGPSGAGKSYVCGTFGVKTLYLFVSGESHGPVSAGIKGGELLDAYCLDYVDGKMLTADQTYEHLMGVITDEELIRTEGYKAIIIDGASELEAVIKGTTKFRKETTSEKGVKNGFAVPDAVISMMRPVLNALKSLQRSIGIHYAVTCILDVKTMGDNGEILDSTPRLVSYGTAEALVQHFDDVLVIGRTADDDDGVEHKIQFNSKVVKTSKTAAGTIKKAANYSPRLGGIPVDKLPASMPADLAAVIKFKRG